MTSRTDRPVVMVVYGTRPEAIKVAPVIHALRNDDSFEVFIVVTAQHREMLDQVNEIFDVRPDLDLNLMSHGQSLNQLSARVMREMDSVLESHRPAAVVVQGDTTTVMATAISAFNREIPVVHLEAGLRSGDIRSPFPEEANRKLVSQIATTHLAPTVQSKRNLLAEGLDATSIMVTGNTVIDALHWAADKASQFTQLQLAEIPHGARVVLLTAHRRENLGQNMIRIGTAVRQLAEAFPQVFFVWPAHKNPEVRAAIGPVVEACENVFQIEPVGYDQFARLIAMSSIVLTDSGGLQEEAPSLGKPVLVMRDTTERPEAVEAGTAKLIGTDPGRIVAEVSILLESEDEYARMANAVNPYGDGRAAERVLGALRHVLLDGERLQDFVAPPGCAAP